MAREKEVHGDTMVQGRDGGSDCLKKQGWAARFTLIIAYKC